MCIRDRIYIDPMGSMMLEGLARYRQYYRRGLQEKLGVDVHLFRVGEFKSAAEPYILDAASPESKEADLYWMNDIWGRYLEAVSYTHLDVYKRQELGVLAQRTPPQERQALRDELLATPAAQRDAWLVRKLGE